MERFPSGERWESTKGLQLTPEKTTTYDEPEWDSARVMQVACDSDINCVHMGGALPWGSDKTPGAKDVPVMILGQSFAAEKTGVWVAEVGWFGWL